MSGTTLTVGRRIDLNAKSTRSEFDPGHAKMTITPEGKSDGITIPYAPREVTHGALSSEWSEVARAGQDSLLYPSNDPRPSMSFSLFFGSTDVDASQEEALRRLAQYARYRTRLAVKYSSWEDGLWQISSMSFTSVRRNTMNQITQAVVDIEFKYAGSLADHIGPVSGGVSNPGNPGGNSGGGKGGTPVAVPLKYKVKKGDTLHSIAVRFYRDASRWKDIAKLNKIKNPRSEKELKVGRTLRMP